MGKLAPLAIRALAAGLRKHGITKDSDLKVIAKRALACGATDVASLHAWANDDKCLSARLRQIVLKLTTIPCPAIGSYPLLSHLASGGMGSVYLSADQQERLIVVKVMKQTRVGDQHYLQRFLRESAMTQRITDKYVVRCLDAGTDDSGQCFLVLEYVPGGDLHQLIRRSQRLDEKQALTILYQMARGLMAAEAEGIIHRDLKPANIFINPKGLAKIGDFGLARTTNEERTMLTLEGAIMGTPRFMSPEQIRAEENIDIRSDIYALGVIAFTTLCGHPPFQGNPSSIFRQHLYDPPPDIASLCPSLHSHTVKIIRKCLNKDPKDRFQSAKALAASVKKTITTIGLSNQAALDQQTIMQAQPIDDEARLASDCETADIPSDSATVTTPYNNPSLLTPATVKPASRPDAVPQAQTETLDSSSSDPAVEMTLDGDITLVGDEAPEIPITQWQGNIDQAISDDWLTLHSPDDEEKNTILLYARSCLTFGKLRADPVDVCLRVYPIETHREACQRISRRHWQLRYDANNYQMQAMDLGSANGLIVNGRMVNPQQAWPLAVSEPQSIDIPNALGLCLMVHPQRSPQNRSLIAGTTPGALGIDSHMTIDGVVITRPDNRPGLIIAQILRCLTIGPEADCPVEGPGVSEVARYADRWIVRERDSNQWQPVTEGMTLPGLGWLVRRGDWGDYQ